MTISQITFLDIAILVLLLFISLVLFNENFKRYKFLSFVIVVEHFILGLVYYNMTITGGGDSAAYYRKALAALSWLDSFDTGTSFIVFLTYPFANYFQLSYLGVFIVFSFVGLLGFYFLLKVLTHIVDEQFNPILLLLLSPNLHFWTVALGKDSLIFFSVCLIIYSLYFKKTYLYYVLPIFLISSIRFHIFSFLGLAYAITTIMFNTHIKKSLKILLITIFIGAGIVLFPIFIQRIGLDDISNLDSYSQRITNANLKGGGAINLQNANIFVKWFAYMFRPLFFDATNIMAILSSFDNAIWLVICTSALLKFNKIKSIMSTFHWFCLLSIFTVSIPMAIGLSNLGIAVRQKTMVLPFLLILLITINHYEKRGYKDK